MFPVANPAQVELQEAAAQNPETPKTREIKESDCSLTSVKTLRQAFVKDKHQRTYLFSLPLYQANFRLELTEILEKHTFVGIVDLERCLSLIQHSTNLYLVNHTALALVLTLNSLNDRIYRHFSEELFYQLGLRQFGDINRLRLEPPPPLRSLVEIAVQVEETEDSPLSKAEIVNVCQSLPCQCH